MGYPLVVSRKNDCVHSPAVIPVAFGQIEQWTKFQWLPLAYAANWSDAAGGDRRGQYCQDPLGFVHLRGAAVYSGTVNSGVIVTIANLPAAYSPLLQESFSIVTTSGAAVAIDVLASGVVEFHNLSAGNLLNPGIWMSGVNYTVF